MTCNYKSLVYIKAGSLAQAHCTTGGGMKAAVEVMSALHRRLLLLETTSLKPIAHSGR